MLKSDYTILYKYTSPAKARMELYNKLASENGFSFQWLNSENEEDTELSDRADGILVSGEESGLELDPDSFFPLATSPVRQLVAVFKPWIKSALLSDTDILKAKITTKLQALKICARAEWQGRLVVEFLKKALPQKIKNIEFDLDPTQDFEGQLALFQSEKADIIVVPLQDLLLGEPLFLQQNPYMILPLFECPPGLSEGLTAIKNVSDAGLRQVLKNYVGAEKARWEKSFELSQTVDGEYGVLHLDLPTISFTYLNGFDGNGNSLEKWKMPLPTGWEGKNLFTSTQHMKAFFKYKYYSPSEAGSTRVSFVASHKAIHDKQLEDNIRDTEVWAAGTKTWFELAKKNIWVTGSADGIGMESLSNVWAKPFIKVSKEDITILTNTESAETWRNEGWKAFGTYDLIPDFSEELRKQISGAEIIFWTSFQQYSSGAVYLSENVIHATPAGKTAQLLADKQPFIFPSIRAFNHWFKKQK